jgi:hypothetical protein
LRGGAGSNAGTATSGTVVGMEAAPSSRHVSLASVIAFAVAAHGAQVDKAGEPYTGHLRRVAARVRDLAGFYGVDPLDAEATAWLHDVLEDTSTTVEELARLVPARIVDAVVALTHRRNEPTEAYFTRIRGVALARAVKAADMDDNADPTRLALLEPEVRERLVVKYASRRALLDAAWARAAPGREDFR